MDIRTKTKKHVLLLLDRLLDVVVSKSVDLDQYWVSFCKSFNVDPKKHRSITFDLIDDKSFPLTFAQQRFVLRELEEYEVLYPSDLQDGQCDNWSKLSSYSLVVKVDNANKLYGELCRELNVSTPGALLREQHGSIHDGSGAVAERYSKKGDLHIADMVDANTTWEDVVIRFIDEKNVVILIDGKRTHTDYKQMGFTDRKKKERPPNIYWELLLILSNVEGGKLLWGSRYSEKTKKKQKSRLVEHLRSFFKIPGDPFEPYSSKRGYKIKIKLYPSPNSPYWNAADKVNKRRSLNDDTELPSSSDRNPNAAIQALKERTDKIIKDLLK